MEQDEINVGNKLIAEFMGYPTTLRQLINDTPAVIVYIIDEINYHPLEMDYHKSWDWLMPVLEKIESLGCKTVASQSDFNDNQYINIMTGISIRNQDAQNPSKFMGQDKIKINAYYKAIVEFIKWINQNDTGRNQ